MIVGISRLSQSSSRPTWSRPKHGASSGYFFDFSMLKPSQIGWEQLAGQSSHINTVHANQSVVFLFYINEPVTILFFGNPGKLLASVLRDGRRSNTCSVATSLAW